MRRLAGLIAAGLLAAAGAGEASGAPAVSRRAVELLERHCARCHNGGNVLDLRRPPPAEDTETWERIRTMVETGRMPPYDDARDEPQVMAPGERQELVSAASALVHQGGRAPGPRRQIDLSPRDWIYVVREVAEPFLSPAALETLLARRRELAPAAKPFWTALDVCTAVVDTDARRSPGRRQLPGSGARRLDDATVDELVQELFELVYREAPDPRDSAAGRARYRRFQARAGSNRQASIALCTSYLTGLRALRIPLGRRAAEVQR
jgi:hypothetical protein